MSKLIAAVLAFLGGAAATIGTTGCVLLIMDEPQMPKSILER